MEAVWTFGLQLIAWAKDLTKRIPLVAYGAGGLALVAVVGMMWALSDHARNSEQPNTAEETEETVKESEDNSETSADPDDPSVLYWRGLHRCLANLNRGLKEKMADLEAAPEPANEEEALRLGRRVATFFREASEAYRTCAEEIRKLRVEGVDREVVEYAKSLRDALIDASSWASDTADLLTELLSEFDKPWWQALLEGVSEMARAILDEGLIGGYLRALEKPLREQEEWAQRFKTLVRRGRKLKDRIDKLQGDEMPLRRSLAEKHSAKFGPLPRIEFGLVDITG